MKLQESNQAQHSGSDRLLAGYYRSHAVHERMIEFRGGVDPWSVASVYIAGNDGYSKFGVGPTPEHIAE